MTVGSASNSSDNSKNSTAPRRVLVTGASGFIGTHLVPKLVAAGFLVSTFGRTSGKPHFESLGVNHICGDVTNYEQVLAASAGHDIIFHMAGLVSYRSADLTRQRAVNVEGTRNVMEAALASGVGRVIHTSSIAAFGIPPEGTIGDETIEYNLTGLNLSYCDTKHEAELVVEEYFRKGLNVITLCPGIIFGEGDTHPHHHFIFRALSKGFMLGVPAGGTPYSDIVDIVDAHLNAIDLGRAGERYSLVSANLSYREAGELFAKIYSCRPPLVTLPQSFVTFAGQFAEEVLPLFHIKTALTKQVAYLSNYKIFFDCKKATAELKFKPTAFSETIRRTASYYLQG